MTQTKNEPQFIEEIKKFRETFHVQTVKTNDFGITHVFPLDDEGRMLVPDVSALETFIATALEEQRTKVIEEVAGWLVDEEVSLTTITREGAEILGSIISAAEGRNLFRAKLRAKLAELKN